MWQGRAGSEAKPHPQLPVPMRSQFPESRVAGAPGAVEVGKAEAVPELVGEHPDLVDLLGVTGQEGLDGVVVDVDESLAVGAGRGRGDPRVQATLGSAPHRPAVGPDAVGAAPAALRPVGGVHDGEDIHESVPGVVVPAPVHPLGVQGRHDGLDEGGHPLGPGRGEPRLVEGDLLVGQPRPDPVVAGPPDPGQPPGHLLVELGDGEGPGVGPVEELLLHPVPGEGRIGRGIGEEAQDQGEVEGPHHRLIPGPQAEGGRTPEKELLLEAPPPEGLLDAEEPVVSLLLEAEGTRVPAELLEVGGGRTGSMDLPQELHVLGRRRTRHPRPEPEEGQGKEGTEPAREGRTTDHGPARKREERRRAGPGRS
jgi:hypothetical protein